MIKTLNPYNSTSTAKTAEIMSRYRPIAPRPETSPTNPTGESPALSQKIRDSPYLRNLWPQLQARPTRTRKRGRAAISPPTLKRQRTTHVFGFSPPCHVTSPVKNLTLDGFPHPLSQLPLQNQLGAANRSLENPNLVTLPLLSYPSSVPIVTNQAGVVPAEHDLPKPSGGEEKLLDLNSVAEIPEEKDLLKQLQGTPSPNSFYPQCHSTSAYSTCGLEHKRWVHQHRPKPSPGCASSKETWGCGGRGWVRGPASHHFRFPQQGEDGKCGLQGDGGSARVFLAWFNGGQLMQKDQWGGYASAFWYKGANFIEWVLMLGEDRVGKWDEQACYQCFLRCDQTVLQVQGLPLHLEVSHPQQRGLSVQF